MQQFQGLHQSSRAGPAELLSGAKREPRRGQPLLQLSDVWCPSLRARMAGTSGSIKPSPAKQQIYARYSWKNALYNEGAMGAAAGQFLPNVVAQDQNRSFLVSYNYVIRPSLINEFRFGFTNFQENDNFPIQGSSAISQLGLARHQYLPASNRRRLPDLRLLGRHILVHRTGSDWNHDLQEYAVHR